MENQPVDARTTAQAISNWRPFLFERQRTTGERLLIHLLPTLWVLAVVAAGAAISW